MSSLHSLRKNISKSTLTFDPDMYTNIVGSLVVTNYILTEDKPEVKDIKKKWKSIKKKGLDFWLDDKDFIPKVLALFNLKPAYGQFAMVQSEYNVLFAPYINGTILPLNENGFYSRTLRNGKIYPIEENVKNDGQTVEKAD